MSLTAYIVYWLLGAFIISQLRLGYVLYKRPRTIRTIAPTGTAGLIYDRAQGIHPHHAVEYIRRSRKPEPLAMVNWGRDGF
jgi:hypothetical protein